VQGTDALLKTSNKGAVDKKIQISGERDSRSKNAIHTEWKSWEPITIMAQG